MRPFPIADFLLSIGPTAILIGMVALSIPGAPLAAARRFRLSCGAFSIPSRTDWRFSIAPTATLVLVPALGLVAAPLAAEAQQAQVPRIGVLSLFHAPDLQVEALKDGLRELGWIEGQSVGVEYRYADGQREPVDSASAFAAIVRACAKALMPLTEPLTRTHRLQIGNFVVNNRLPMFSEIRDCVDVGGLMRYGPSLLGLWRRAAASVDKILRGAKPGDLPVEQPTTFELVITLKTAQALGLTIPESVLIRADEVMR